jgi:hypothetical protein
MDNILLALGLLASLGIVTTASNFTTKAAKDVINRKEYWTASLQVFFFSFVSMLFISSGMYIQGIRRANVGELDSQLNRFLAFCGCPGVIALVFWAIIAIAVWRLQESRLKG